MSDGKILEMYTAYLAACNNRAWETIAGFVHSSVLVNGIQRTREQYVNDIRKTIAVFPDYVWGNWSGAGDPLTRSGDGGYPGMAGGEHDEGVEEVHAVFGGGG